jgi:hypothetical protein
MSGMTLSLKKSYYFVNLRRLISKMNSSLKKLYEESSNMIVNCCYFYWKVNSGKRTMMMKNWTSFGYLDLSMSCCKIQNFSNWSLMKCLMTLNSNSGYSYLSLSWHCRHLCYLSWMSNLGLLMMKIHSCRMS